MGPGCVCDIFWVLECRLDTVGAFHSTETISWNPVHNWMEQFPEIRLENFGPPLEVILLSGNLEIPEIFIWHFYPAWIIASSFVVVKSYEMAASLSSRHYTGCDLPQFEPVFDHLFSTKKVRIWFPGKVYTGRFEFPLCQFTRFTYSPSEKRS